MEDYDNFCLRFNSFGENVKLFYDLTLACEYKQIQTHKIIVSSCSHISQKSQVQRSSEVNVTEEDLTNFLDLSEDFQITGLAEIKEGAKKLLRAFRANTIILPFLPSKHLN